MKAFTWAGVLIGAIGASLFAIQANAGTPGDSGKPAGIAFIGMLGGTLGGGIGTVIGLPFRKKQK